MFCKSCTAVSKRHGETCLEEQFMVVDIKQRAECGTQTWLVITEHDSCDSGILSRIWPSRVTSLLGDRPLVSWKGVSIAANVEFAVTSSTSWRWTSRSIFVFALQATLVQVRALVVRHRCTTFEVLRRTTSLPGAFDSTFSRCANRAEGHNRSQV